MALLPPIPVDRFLVPDAPLRPPDEFIVVDQPMSAGLPHVVDLDKDAKLLVIVPTGMVADWRDADPSSIVSRSDEQVQPFSDQPAEPVADAFPAPVQALLVAGTETIASVPLVAGVRQFVPDNESTGVRIELFVRSWQISAGTLRGPGDFGSRISLAWRRASDGIAQFSTPAPNPVLIPRMPPENRTASTLGAPSLNGQELARFRSKRSLLR